ncbi:MAG: winged helix-turn-helix transcriptional regulator [Thermoplasmata archaeon]
MTAPPSSRVVPRRVELDPVCVIREGAEEYCIYPLDRVMTVLGKKWTLFVIAVLGNRDRTRFNALLADLRFISSRTLTDRLKELVSLQLVDRIESHRTSPRVEYRLTSHGQELRRRLIPLLDWAIGFETGVSRSVLAPV